LVVVVTVAVAPVDGSLVVTDVEVAAPVAAGAACSAGAVVVLVVVDPAGRVGSGAGAVAGADGAAAG
jgi:hypothetical protein